MKLFINYNSDTDCISLNTFRQPSGYYHGDVTGLVTDILAGISCSCALEGTKAALEDGSLWQDDDDTQVTIEFLHDLISMHENTEKQRDILLPSVNWQTKARGTNDDEYQIYLACADDGKGGDITRKGAPLLTYDEWLMA